MLLIHSPRLVQASDKLIVLASCTEETRFDDCKKGYP